MKIQNNQKGAGAVVGIVIIIIIIIIGAIYFFGKQTSQTNSTEGTTTSVNGQSDDVASLQADASAMNYDNLGADADSIQ